MKILSREEFNQLTKGAAIVEQDGCGVKVLSLLDGTFLKLFRNKRFISSARIYPYARRFADNANSLKKAGIRSVTVLETYKIKLPPRSIVRYQPLSGKTVREVAIGNLDALKQNQIKKIAQFIATLHNKGVYFRSLHLGNILITTDGSLGLIDIADMKFYNKPLSVGKRIRNFRHLMRYKNDAKLLLQNEPVSFIDSYLEANHSILSEKDQLKIANSLYQKNRYK
ncbi:toluene tolerance protein [Endozoicomonas sp. SM1973]|uniref:Toluene tolerance protein n=1 Tax=Spartinivicinus marinus TaxID=2994442 RepID=A0A853I9N9_9GAMM|nr:toluene tolerance protein [Spartinivicinus marinus]MCX4026098.1 hypothetical protein [Spartinivicinus marinus]NYZ66581.1 toluene tolerance protein [Spartinivicinus marinus]